MKRIAVCISGQLRNWRTCVANQKWFWTSSQCEVDYFVHSWDYSMERTAVSKPYEQRDITHEEWEEFNEAYEPKLSIFDTKRQDYFFDGDHWSSLFYSLSQSILLKRKYEIENGFEYDIVVKSRPDVVFSPTYHFSYDLIQDNVVYTTHGGLLEHEFNGFNFNDCVFYTNSYTMDLLIDLYFYRISKIDPKSKTYDPRFHLVGPGVLMRNFFGEYGIVGIPSFEFLETLVKKGHPEGLDLLDPQEFRGMEKYFRDWYTK